MAYYPGEYSKWESDLSLMLKSEVIRRFAGPVRLDAIFAFPVPDSCTKKERDARLNQEWHTQKPDRDNLAKALMDALNHTGVWNDDSQVCCGNVEKRWSENGYIAVTITEL